MVNSKPALESKTIIVNVIALFAVMIQSQTGYIVTPEVQAAILTIANVILRFLTKGPIKKKGSK
jgi:fumarate reductase subunit C